QLDYDVIRAVIPFPTRRSSDLGGNVLNGKEFGLVFVVGIREQEYQAGGRELFSISELMRPFQAMAHKTGMTYIKPMPIFQFNYLTEAERLNRSEEHTSELQSRFDLVCRLLLEKKKIY